MRYHFKHVTKFSYERSIRETVMELRMHPLTDSFQQCIALFINVNPHARLFRYDDHLGNVVHHFDIPEDHNSLYIDVDGEVEVHAPPPLPNALSGSAWTELAARVAAEDFSEMLTAGQLTQPTVAAIEYGRAIGCGRRADPLTVLTDINHHLYKDFQYAPLSTEVDTHIDEVLSTRRGVCQDFAHLMVVLVRSLHIPCRYVSGYLYATEDEQAPQASHAWVEAWLPGLDWVGFDPTHDRPANERYIRTAVGRDYAEVPPTKGVFKGESACRLEVGVSVSPMASTTRDATVAWRSQGIGGPMLTTQGVHATQ